MRAQSVLCGLTHAHESSSFACVHDAARPLIDPQDIERVCRAAFESTAALAVAEMTDTVKHVVGGKVERTIDRQTLVRAQTPQCCDIGLLRAAMTQAVGRGLPITDESSALEIMGIKPVAVLCPPSNIKITTVEDLVMAEALLEEVDR